ncbi:MAG TPA: triphosphoribosyl-dephospho-CoA synthase CitG [Sphaerochaeta sp.]|jgi:triphosphoribosyl-dephospho-CoA synthase CitG|nr:triphosphoribosyl-dephospho-CoA synthase CitG [Sphaerochaeta sp.]
MKQIKLLATKALLEEVHTTPKPGLVDRLGSGGHTDMDYHTFEKSAYALEPYFGEMGELGNVWKGSLPDLFREVRKIGLKAEEAMFSATRGVNTHKGMLFSVGILCAVSGYATSQYNSSDTDLLCSLATDMTKHTLEDEFRQILKSTNSTHGEELYAKQGIRGIRGEVIDGFVSVRKLSLPWYAEYLRQGRDPNLARLQVLLALMANVTDTNVLYRHGAKTLEYVQMSAHHILQKGGAFTEDGMKLIEELDRVFTERRISCGGCADLLGVTIFLYDLSLLDKEASAVRVVNY